MTGGRDVRLFESLFRPRAQQRSLTVDGWYEQFQYALNNYLVTGGGVVGDKELPDPVYLGHVQSAYKANGVVFAGMLARASLFSEARFQFQRMRGGRTGDLFGTDALAPLENPWRSGQTGDLLSRMIQDADLAGNAFIYRAGSGPTLRRLRPDWTEIIMNGDPRDGFADVVGYLYHHGGRGGGRVETLDASRVAHWAPTPDPEASFRGMSWLTPVLREIQSDKAATVHKAKFFENGATLSSVISLKESVTEEQFKKFVSMFQATHGGVENAYRNLVVGGGADVHMVGADMRQLEFRATQGAGETRIAAAAGMHPVILGLSESLAGSSLNSGNFGAARRLTADKTLRPLWRSACATLSTIVDVPSGARLWIDDRDIPFLREDLKDLAEIQSHEAMTIRTLIDGGWAPASVQAAVANQDWSLLEHTGLLSVQLQAPGSRPPDKKPLPGE